MGKPSDIPYISLAKTFTCLAKKSLGVLSEKLENTGLDRFFYPMLKVYEAKGTLTQQRLSDVLNTDKVTTVRIVDYLSKKGLLKRQVNKLDRREHHLILTPKGEKVIPEIEKGFQEFETEAFRGLNKEQKQLFIEVLNKVELNISSLPAKKLQMRVNYNKNKKAAQ